MRAFFFVGTPLGVLASFAWMQIPSAHAVGRIEVDSSSFFQSSGDRETNVPTGSIEVNLAKKGSVLEFEVDPKAYWFLVEPEGITPTAKNAYLATGEGISKQHRVSLGRRYLSWSKVDQYNDVGLWSPRFSWDPIHSESEGLTGVFYRYRSRDWEIHQFASYVAIPERGAPFEFRDGELVSESPLPPQLPDTLILPNRVVPIRYDLEEPPISSILSPSVATKVKYQPSQFWGSFGYANKPIHQVDIAVEGFLKPSAEYSALIRPQLWRHHLFTLEGGVEKKGWGIWASLTHEIPIADELPKDWVYQPLGTAWISSVGTEISITRTLRFNTSYFRVDENKPPANRPLDIEISLPSRFPYESATRNKLVWDASSRVRYETGWIYDLGTSSHLGTFDFTYQSRTSGARWVFGIGTDLIVSTTDEGRFGQFSGDDRVRAKVAYAF